MLITQTDIHKHGVAAGDRVASFSDNIMQFLKQISYRKVTTEAERQEVFQFRYQAYMRQKGIADPDYVNRAFTDPEDDKSNCSLFAIYMDGELSASIRFHIGAPGLPETPSASTYPDIIQPILRDGESYIDPTRFCTARDGGPADNNSLAFATIRLICMATEHYRVDHIIAAIRGEHRAFYKRYLLMNEVVHEGRAYPYLARPLILMETRLSAVRDKVAHRSPFLQSTEEERAALFGIPRPGVWS